MYIYFVISSLKWYFRFSVIAQYNDDLKFGEALDKDLVTSKLDFCTAIYLWDNLLLNIVQVKRLRIVLGGWEKMKRRRIVFLFVQRIVFTEVTNSIFMNCSLINGEIY